MIKRFLFVVALCCATISPSAAQAIVPEPTPCVTDYSMSSPAGYGITSGHAVVLGQSTVNRSVTLVRTGDLCAALPPTTVWAVTGPGFNASGTLANLIDSSVLVDVPISNREAGRQTVGITVGTGPSAEVTERPISLLRRTVWSVTDATPEPVHRGDALRVTASLQRADWSEGEYVAYNGRSVRLQVRLYTGTWDDTSSVAGDVTDARGRADLTVTAGADLVWRFHYSGNSVSSHADARGDAVRLVRE